MVTGQAKSAAESLGIKTIAASLATLERTVGPDHVAVGWPLAVYAGALFQRRIQLDKAEEYLKRSIPILEKTYGKNNPVLVDVLNTYAALLRETGHKSEARNVEKRAKAICEVSR